MCSFHCVEICELVGLFILDILNEENIFCDGNFGIYRDDGLAVVDILPEPDMERKVEQLRKVFKNIGFDVTIEANLFVTDFLDVTLDYGWATYGPRAGSGLRSENDLPLNHF